MGIDVDSSSSPVWSDLNNGFIDTPIVSTAILTARVIPTRFEEGRISEVPRKRLFVETDTFPTQHPQKTHSPPEDRARRGGFEPPSSFEHWMFAPQVRDSNPTPCLAGPPPLGLRQDNCRLKSFSEGCHVPSQLIETLRSAQGDVCAPCRNCSSSHASPRLRRASNESFRKAMSSKMHKPSNRMTT